METVIANLKKHADETPDKIAIIAEDIQISYSELWNEACGYAAYLCGLGFERGSRIVVKAVPSLDYAVAMFACHIAGYIPTPIEKNLGRDGIKSVIETLSASMFIGDEDVSANCDFASLTDVRSTAEKNFREDFRFSLPASDEPCDILFTTGTTGKSKGVLLSHRAQYCGADNTVSADKLTEHTVYLIAVPMNHASGLGKFYACIVCGGTCVLLDGFMNLKKFYDAISKYGVTALLLPPSAVRILLTVSKKELAKYSDQIEIIHSGSTAMPESDKETLVRLFPNTKLIFAYGASEARCSSAYDYSKYPGKANCIGKSGPHSRIFIVDDNKQAINSSKDNLGLIAVTGDTIMECYYGEPELTATVLQDGIFYTNDIGYIDKDGFIYMLARKGDVINVGGLKIAPSEVENVAMRFPGVIECACFGIPDKITGFAPKLNIVLDPAMKFELVKFRAWLQKNLEYFKIPKEIDFVDELPKTSNGKLDRKQLR